MSLSVHFQSLCGMYLMYLRSMFRVKTMLLSKKKVMFISRTLVYTW